MHPNSDILWLDSTESTNKEVRRRIHLLDNMSVIASVEQTAGRGQGDHKWYSARGESLTFSIFANADGIPASSAETIFHATTLGLVDYLHEKGVSARIKWPNDIWVDEKKICGILIENCFCGETIEYSIVGIGLNLNNVSWPDDLPNPVSLKELTCRDYNPETELESIVKKICRRFSGTGCCDGRNSLQGEFEKYVFRHSSSLK